MSLFSRPSNGQVIAFAGIFQAASLVHELARSDHYHVTALTMTTRSLLLLEPRSEIDVFGSVEGIRHGLETLVAVLGGRPETAHREILQYSVSMHQLQQSLNQSITMQEVISKGLSELQQQYRGFIDAHDDLASEEALQHDLAALYTRSLSYLTRRIMVQSSQERLENPLTINRIRTVLFGGVRAAFLWHQLGGRRWHLILQRKQYLAVAKGLLA